MKKIILPILCMLLMVGFVSAWGASRTISGNTVTVTIDETGGSGIFTLTETVSGASIGTIPSNCGKHGSVVVCDSDDSTQRTISYATSGSGSVSGTITGGYPSSTKAVTGDSSIGSSDGGGDDTTPATTKSSSWMIWVGVGIVLVMILFKRK